MQWVYRLSSYKDWCLFCHLAWKLQWVLLFHWYHWVTVSTTCYISICSKFVLCEDRHLDITQYRFLNADLKSLYMHGDGIYRGSSLNSGGSYGLGNDPNMPGIENIPSLAAEVEWQNSLQNCDKSIRNTANSQRVQLKYGSPVNTRLTDGFKLSLKV